MMVIAVTEDLDQRKYNSHSVRFCVSFEDFEIKVGLHFFSIKK